MFRKRLITRAVPVIASFVPAFALAQGIDVCYSLPHHEGKMVVVGNEPLSITDKFDCSQLGKKSLQELNAAGWSVVNISYVGSHDPQNRTWMVVVERK